MTVSIESKFFDLSGLRMHALCCGDPSAPAVVFLHGFPELSESWREILPQAAQAGFFAVAPDLRGYGQTDKPNEGYDVRTLGEDIVALVHALGKKRAHVVGHDWGGAIAYSMAAHHPETVDRLCVVNCPHPTVFHKRIYHPRQAKRSWYILFFQIPGLAERLLSRDNGSLAARMIRTASKDKSRLTRERLTPYARNFSDIHAARCALAYYRTTFKRLSDYARVPQIQAPFRLVWCEEDVALHPMLTEGYEPYFTQPVDVKRIPGVGHFGPIEAPDKVGPLILEHLQPVSRAVAV
jgi:pimeloyl-ACP methyl ester carboxylesterase